MAHAMNRRQWLAATGGAALAANFAPLARAAAYPSHPVRLLVGAAPGGPSDFMGRIYADSMAPLLGQALVVDNKPGASGTLAADAAARAPADGHTLLVSGPAPITAAPYLMKLNYDPATAFVPVQMLGAGAFVLVVHPSVPAKTVQELVALARSKPGALTYGSGGNGSSGHLCTETFSQLTGAKMVHVPYKGDGLALNDLIGGQIQVLFTAPNVALPHVKSGRLRLLAVTTRERVSALPEVPTISESIGKEFEYLGWIVVFAPSGMPRPAIATLVSAWDKARVQPSVHGRLEDLAMVAPERLISGPALEQFIRAESVRQGKLIHDHGIKSE